MSQVQFESIVNNTGKILTAIAIAICFVILFMVGCGKPCVTENFEYNQKDTITVMGNDLNGVRKIGIYVQTFEDHEYVIAREYGAWVGMTHSANCETCLMARIVAERKYLQQRAEDGARFLSLIEKIDEESDTNFALFNSLSQRHDATQKYIKELKIGQFKRTKE